MPNVALIHTNTEEAKSRVATLRAAGYTVSYKPVGPQLLRDLKQKPPDALVIDLTRQPGMGRDVAIAMRHAKSTRYVPLVFVEGDPAKVARIRQQVPDAVHTTWPNIHRGLERAIANPPKNPLVPESVLAGYSGTPLPKKLGMKPGSTLVLLAAPQGFERTLGPLPDNVTVKRQARGRSDLTLWFVTSKKDLSSRLSRILPLTEQGGALWIIWPKKASGQRSDLTQAEVRRVGLAAGLVDFKVCAVDQTWSGLKFVRRKQGGRSKE